MWEIGAYPGEWIPSLGTLAETPVWTTAAEARAFIEATGAASIGTDTWSRANLNIMLAQYKDVYYFWWQIPGVTGGLMTPNTWWQAGVALEGVIPQETRLQPENPISISAIPQEISPSAPFDLGSWSWLLPILLIGGLLLVLK